MYVYVVKCKSGGEKVEVVVEGLEGLEKCSPPARRQTAENQKNKVASPASILTTPPSIFCGILRQRLDDTRASSYEAMPLQTILPACPPSTQISSNLPAIYQPKSLKPSSSSSPFLSTRTETQMDSVPRQDENRDCVVFERYRRI